MSEKTLKDSAPTWKPPRLRDPDDDTGVFRRPSTFTPLESERQSLRPVGASMPRIRVRRVI